MTELDSGSQCQADVCCSEGAPSVGIFLDDSNSHVGTGRGMGVNASSILGGHSWQGMMQLSQTSVGLLKNSVSKSLSFTGYRCGLMCM